MQIVNMVESVVVGSGSLVRYIGRSSTDLGMQWGKAESRFTDLAIFNLATSQDTQQSRYLLCP